MEAIGEAAPPIRETRPIGLLSEDLSELPSQYITTEEDEPTELEALEAELAREQERFRVLTQERRALQLRDEIAKLRSPNAAQERQIEELTSASEASGHHQSRGLSRAARDRTQGQGHGRYADTRTEVEQLMAGLTKRRQGSPSPGTSTEGGPDSSDIGTSRCFSLASRDQKRGKTNKHKQSQLLSRPSAALVSNNVCETNDQKPDGKVYSGIRDKQMETIVNKQKYPHAALQPQYLWGWSGEEIDFKKLPFGLFVAGEVEIIMGGSLPDRDAWRQLDMLKTTAYRSQNIEWPKLLHVHAAVLGKIESGSATWDSNFERVEKMVLENPGRVDWSARLGLRQPRSSRRGAGADRQGRPQFQSRGDDKNQKAITWWCKDYQSGTCNQVAPHSKNIRGREVTVKHICARCFQKEGAERGHPDTAVSCPHNGQDSSWLPVIPVPNEISHQKPTPSVCNNESVYADSEGGYEVARWGNVTSVVESRQPVCEMAVGVTEERENEEGDLEPSAGMNNVTPEQPKYGNRVVPEAGLNGTVAIEDVDEDVDEVWCLSESGLAVCGADEPHQAPLNPMAAEFSPRPRIPMKCDAEVRDSIRLHSVIKRSGMPNFRGCRIPIKTGLNIGEIRELAVGFPDRDAIDFLEYGFPISFVGEVHQTLPPGNHKGAREFPEAIDDYVRRECELGATLGPFAENPLEDSALAISPLNSMPKTDASERRVILDLSFPPVQRCEWRYRQGAIPWRTI